MKAWRILVNPVNKHLVTPKSLALIQDKLKGRVEIPEGIRIYSQKGCPMDGIFIFSGKGQVTRIDIVIERNQDEAIH